MFFRPVADLENECHSNQDCAKVTPNSSCGRKGNASLCVCEKGFKMSRNKIRCDLDKYGNATLPKGDYWVDKACSRALSLAHLPVWPTYAISQLTARLYEEKSINFSRGVAERNAIAFKNSTETSGAFLNAVNIFFLGFFCAVISPSTVNPTKVSPNNEISQPKLKPASLGHTCNVTGECKLRDKQSACIDGVCQCLNPTSRCSASHAGCLNDTFQCRNGQCISWYFVCDGMKNCADGSDESGCKKHSCPSTSFQCDDGTCKSKASVCNGKWECPDGSDEARCYKGIKCDRHAFQCKNGQCLPKYVFCNAVVDCIDGSDEEEAACVKGTSCPADSFRCKNNMCRSSAILCSGVDGCGDNSDEIGCEVCSKYELS
ncbi:unnamed protein product [Ixodes hexagonus]